MRSLFLLSALFLSSLISFAQEVIIDTAALKADLAMMDRDSLLKELRGMLDSSGNKKSFFSANFSVSNRLFSNTNNAFNAQQTSSNAAFTPSLTYFHRSGLGIGATAFVRPGGDSSGLYQIALTPSYDHVGEKAMYGISYTRYLKTDPANTFTTPYDNELYAYFQWRKSWLRPSLTLGWAEGSYRDISRIPIRVGGNSIFIVDTSRIIINDFSLIAGISHTFSFNDVLTRDDMLTLLPQFSLIGGIQQFNTQTLSRGLIFGNRTRLDDLLRIRERYNFRSSSTSSPFTLQTAAVSINLSWYKGAFSISGGYFAGYYFQSGTSTQWSHIFNASVGFTF